MVKPVELEQLYRRALTAIAGADEADAAQMPLDLMSRMYGRQAIMNMRAAVCWATLLLVARQRPGLISLEGAVKEQARAMGQRAAGWAVNNGYSSPYGRMVIPYLEEGALLRRYYEDLNGAHSMMASERLASTVGSAYPAHLINALFEMSIVIEALTQNRGSGTFPTDSLADEWLPNMQPSHLRDMTNLLSRIMVPILTEASTRPTFYFLQDLGYVADMMAYVRDILVAVIKDPAKPNRLLPGELHITDDSIYVSSPVP